MKYLKVFNSEAEYNAEYDKLLLPNVSYIRENGGQVLFNPEYRTVSTYNVTSTSEPTILLDNTNSIENMWLDGVLLETPVTEYTFNEIGEHKVYYTFIGNEIGYGEFWGCSSLTSIVIGNGITSIGYNTFQNCTNLTNIIIPDSIVKIENFSFYGCSKLTEIIIPNNVISIGYDVFRDCNSLANVIIGNSVTSIGSQAFYGCSNLMKIVIPKSLLTIDSSAFYQACSKLTEVYISDIVAWCNINFITYDSNPLFRGNNLYLNNELVTNLVIPNDVTSIKNYTFNACTSITSAVIPDSVTSIGDKGFYNCRNLASVYCKAITPPTLGNNSVFDGNASGRIIYVPEESIEAYKAAQYWSEYADNIEGYNFE